MQVSSFPYKFAEIWAKNASASYLNSTIPQTTGSGTAASQDLGFPPATATPIGSGGTPPSIKDFNGALQYETSWTQVFQAWNGFAYDATFSTNIGGYPAGAWVRAASGNWNWVSGADNNTSDPDTGGANWTRWEGGSFPRFFASVTANHTWTGSSVGTLVIISASSTSQTVNSSTFQVGDTIGFLANGLGNTVSLSGGNYQGGIRTGQTVITLPYKSWVSMQFDGTNWQIFSSSPDGASGTFPANITSAGISTTWGPANNGWLIYLTGSGTTQTINSSVFNPGATIGFQAAAGPTTVTLSSGNFQGGGVTGSTSIIIPTGGWIAAQYDGTNWRVFSASGEIGSIRGEQWFTSAGTTAFTVPTPTAYVEVWGGGGGGYGSAANGSAAGGSGGGYSQKLLTGLMVGSSVNVTVGGGGAGGSSGGNNGASGGSSSFGSFLSSTGGGGGLVSAAGTPGSGSSGAININGGPGGGSIVGPASTYYGGPGGGTAAGAPMAPAVGGTAAGGNFPGGGGSGGGSTTGANAGGNGATGAVYVRWPQ